MPITSGSIFGIHEQALLVRARRAELLASNLANADTPGYKARDVSFAALFRDGALEAAPRLRRTKPGHLSAGVTAGGNLPVQYRNPTQPTVDGNTVDTQREQTEFLSNALAYQASLSFLERRIAGLRLALRGE